MRLAIVATHPIQHFVPFYRRIAKEQGLDLHVFYMSDFSVRGYFDKLMGTQIAWNMDMLSGYAHTFLPEAKRINRSNPIELNNPSIGPALDAFGPQVVLGYGYNQVTQWRVLHWSWRRGVPLMMISDSELLHRRSKLRNAAKTAVLPVLLARYSAFLTTGDNNEAYFSAYGIPAERMFRCPFTIDEDQYRAARQVRDRTRAKLREELGLPSDAFVGITVGKLIPRKRPMDLVDAARALKRTGTDRIHLLMAGDGALRHEIDACILGEGLPIRTLGFVNVDRLPEVYCAADVLLHLSEFDAHPLTLSEAACIGLPLIVSDKVGAIGPTDIARAGENTIVTPCGDVGAIAAAVTRLADDPELVARMSDASIRIYSELDMSRSVAGLKAAVEYCMAQRTGQSRGAARAT